MLKALLLLLFSLNWVVLLVGWRALARARAREAWLCREYAKVLTFAFGRYCQQRELEALVMGKTPPPTRQELSQ
jgi:hypothetical protein